MKKQLWTKTGPGTWACRAGRCQTVLTGNNPLTGRSSFVWVSFGLSGQNLGSFKSLAQAKLAVESQP